jgi:succinate dehydrogenase/fumarate reductase flavoprotein subunit
MAQKSLSYEQLNKSLNIIEGQSQASNADNEIRALIDRVKNIVGNNLGIVRNEVNLTEAKRQLANLWLEIKDLDEYRKDIFELKQMVRLANLMIEAASRRTESRGVQFRSDFDALDDSWATSQTLIKT